VVGNSKGCSLVQGNGHGESSACGGDKVVIPLFILAALTPSRVEFHQFCRENRMREKDRAGAAA
jgi:hypothetical protein